MQLPASRHPLLDLTLYVGVALSLIVLLFPIAWMVSTAFKTSSQVFEVPPVWIPREVSLDAFARAFTGPLPVLFANSVIVAVGSAFLSTFAGALSAYGLSRVPFRGGNAVLLFFLSSMAFPIPLIMISMYIMFFNMGLLNTYFALIIGHTVITLPVSVWLLKSFFDTLPIEVEEAALIDGASPLYTLIHIVFPMARPGMAAAAIFVFVTSWNEFVFGLTFVSSNALRPLPAGISLLFLQEFQYQWPDMMAVATIATMPILLLFLAFQRHFIRGVTAGAVKA